METTTLDFSPGERLAMAVLACIALGFGALFAAGAVWWVDLPLGVFTAPVLATGGLVLWARASLAGPARQRSLLAVAYAIVAVSSTGALVLPTWRPPWH